MNIRNILLQILVNGLTMFFLFAIFMNIDLLNISRMVIMSVIVTQAYLVNKKLRMTNKKCVITFKQIGIALGFGMVTTYFFSIIRKLF